MPRALVIGGTRGLGQAIVLGAVGRRFEVIATGRKPLKNSQPSPVVYRKLDLTKTDGDRDFERTVSRTRDLEISHVFIVAGSYLQKPLAECSGQDIQTEFATNVLGTIQFLRRFHSARIPLQEPYRLVIVSSTAAIKRQERASVHAASKAAISGFAKEFAHELAADLPGSTTLLVQPGRMQSGTHPPGTNLSTLLKPHTVAELIWDVLEQQSPEEPCLELNIFRNPDGTPRAECGGQPIKIRDRF